MLTEHTFDSGTFGFKDDSFTFETIRQWDYYFVNQLTNYNALNTYYYAMMGGEMYPSYQSIIFSDHGMLILIIKIILNV